MSRKLDPTQREDIARSTDPAHVIADRFDIEVSTVYRVKRQMKKRAAASGISWKYSEEDKERALTYLALAGGNAQQTVKNLHGSGILKSLSANTLSNWAAEEPERVERLRAEVIPKIHEAIAVHHEEVAMEAAEATREYVKASREAMSAIAPRDLPGAARNMATIFAISTDKAALLRGKPTVIEERRDVGEILSALARLGVKVDAPHAELAVEGTVAADDAVEPTEPAVAP